MYFTISSPIIIPKPNKAFYNSLKIFRPIILLNMLGKLIKKVIGKRIQFQSISKNFIHPCQLGRLKQYSTIDAGVILTYFIYMRWVKNLFTSILAFNITQFFLLLNYYLLLLILDKADLDSKISIFFQDYLVDKKTEYYWDNFPFFFLMLILVLDRVLPYYLFDQLFIFLQFFIFLKKD